jgi:hypothetical protein
MVKNVSKKGQGSWIKTCWKSIGTYKIVNDGPGANADISALLLNRLSKLVETVEHNVNKKFILQNGSVINVEKDGNNYILPILFPINLDSNFDAKKVPEAISDTPEHEALAYGMCLQVTVVHKIISEKIKLRVQNKLTDIEK